MRKVAREPGVSRRRVRRHLNTPESMPPKDRPMWGAKLDHYTGHAGWRMSKGLENRPLRTGRTEPLATVAATPLRLSMGRRSG